MSTDKEHNDEGSNELVAFRLGEGLYSRLDDRVKAGEFESRSAAIREYIRFGLRVDESREELADREEIDA